jgi:hypothetical protein
VISILVVGILFFGLLFFAVKRSMNIKASCKLPFVNISLEAQQPSKEASQVSPNAGKG